MSAAFDKLRSKLSELFQLDAAAELDFGIYRILNARRVEVEAFLDSLQPQVDDILSQALQTGTTELKAELEKVEAGLRAGGIDEDMIATAPKVKELRGKIVSAGGDPTALTHDIFSHLTTFFSRYYKDGDFLSLRRYKRDTYAIPYEGEEVKLYWANADQYYIKSAENFRDYTFKLSTAEDAPRITFKLVEADTQKDNTKATVGQERRFVYQGVIESEDKTHRTLGFAYLPIGKDKKQADLNKQAIADILKDAAKGPFVALASPDKTYTGKKKEGRTLLEKHLTDYTARNTFDYFIHKDLGGFLRRELDFYIKNEVLHLDDLDEAPETNWRETRARLKALRTLADKVIRFLAQIEDFQKKLWLKKKFVTACDYVVTLDRIPEALYPEIAACEAQREEWVRLFAIDEIKADLGRTGYSVPLKGEFLKENQGLTVNTRCLPLRAKHDVVSSIGDNACSMVVKADCGSGLKFMQGAKTRNVTTVFTDPPYNTGEDGFPYKDSYQHSSWLSMIAERFMAVRSLMNNTSLLFATIDYVEVSRFRVLLDQIFGEACFVADIAWEKRYTRSNNAKRFYSLKDTILTYRRSTSREEIKELRSDKSRENYTNPDKDERGPWISSSYVNPATRSERENLCYKIQNPFTKIWVEHPTHAWKYEEETNEEHIRDNRLYWGEDGGYEYPRLKSFLSEARAGMVPVDVWKYEETGTTDDGGKAVKDLFGFEAFKNPKPPRLIERCIKLEDGLQETCVLDFFGGSGTTGHAVINLNREDGGSRKFILIEMGEHLDTVLVPRLKKVIYSKDWRDGKPQSRNTSVSHCFKVLHLESYEDTLNNLRLHRNRAQELALESMTAEAREEYQLGYMLDLEATGSQSLLNVSAFTDPFSYTLNIATGTAGETKPVTVDLVETFNWLLGLTVLAQGRGGGVIWVEGINPEGEKILVLWRNTESVDADALNTWCKKQKVSVLDGEFSIIYINGDHHLENLRRDDQTWKVRLTDEEFPKFMWEGCLE